MDAETQEKHTAMLLNDIGEDLEPTVEVVGGDRLSLGGDVSITVVETPGHSIGSVTFVLDRCRTGLLQPMRCKCTAGR